MENNRDRKGIFLGVISVATLIVAIIGATFAYFSASVTANEEVNFTAYQFSASASVTQIAPAGGAVSDLIPVDAENVLPLASNTRNDPSETDVNGACKDLNGYSACLVYEVTIVNSGSGSLNMTGELITTEPGAYTHLKIMPASKSGTTYTAAGDAMDISSTQNGTTGVFTTSSGASDVTFSVGTGNSNEATYYFIIYLDNDENGQNEEMGETFAGQLVFSNNDGGQLKASIAPVSP